MNLSSGRGRNSSLTKLLERAFDAARRLPTAAQEDLALIILQLAGSDDETLSPLTTPEEAAAIAKSRTAAHGGDFATDDEVKAVWAKRGL